MYAILIGAPLRTPAFPKLVAWFAAWTRTARAARQAERDYLNTVFRKSVGRVGPTPQIPFPGHSL